MRQSQTAYLILGMPSVEPRKSGYDIRKAVESSVAYFWRESYGETYSIASDPPRWHPRDLPATHIDCLQPSLHLLHGLVSSQRPQRRNVWLGTEQVPQPLRAHPGQRVFNLDRSAQTRDVLGRIQPVIPSQRVAVFHWRNVSSCPFLCVPLLNIGMRSLHLSRSRFPEKVKWRGTYRTTGPNRTMRLVRPCQ